MTESFGDLEERGGYPQGEIVQSGPKREWKANWESVDYCQRLEAKAGGAQEEDIST
jgi:hypothetical protein